MLRKILYGLGIILIIAQFFKPEKNISSEVSKNDISTRYEVPGNVKVILEKACNDCHSNNTKYPWYANIQPVAWWLNDHIKDGKKHLNFSEFAAYTYKRADHKMEEVIESQEDHWMPLDSYTWLHKDAKLTEEERGEIVGWAKGLRVKIMADSVSSVKSE
jgi:hypothetical protein